MQGMGGGDLGVDREVGWWGGMTTTKIGIPCIKRPQPDPKPNPNATPTKSTASQRTAAQHRAECQPKPNNASRVSTNVRSQNRAPRTRTPAIIPTVAVETKLQHYQPPYHTQNIGLPSLLPHAGSTPMPPSIPERNAQGVEMGRWERRGETAGTAGCDGRVNNQK
jgi:hypothetical protein